MAADRDVRIPIAKHFALAVANGYKDMRPAELHRKGLEFVDCQLG
jgi:hypothetical protein